MDLGINLLYYKNKIMNGDIDSSSSESSDTEDELITSEKNFVKVNIKNYISSVVPYYTGDDFQSHFRLNRAAVEKLLIDLKENYICLKKGRPEFDLKSSLLLTLWCLANQESFRGVGDRFGMTKGEAYKLFIRICKKIYSLKEKYIVWPKNNDALRTVDKFNRLGGFPNVIGCIDGCHIPIPGKAGDNSYYNRKGFYSVVLQAICNAKLQFINVFAGWPGSSHDARVFANSPIQQLLSNDVNQEYVPMGCHLLGDSAYPLRTFLMVPYRDNGHLSPSKKMFNTRLSKKRVFIENAFARLKGSFRRLKYLYVNKYENIKYIIISSCILQNICINEGLQLLEDVDVEVPIEQPPDELRIENELFNDVPAAQKRENIKRNLN